jgi:hypothetical protein
VASALMLVSVALSASAPCSGWSTSDEARMACCSHGHGGNSQGAADSCCAAGEQRQNASGSQIVAAPPPQLAIVDLFGAAIVPPLERAPITHRVPHGPPRSAQILLSVFLI